MEIKSKLVSVIIPAYNHDQYILYTLNSLLSQTYSNIEIIIINDHSTDTTDKVVKEFIKQHQLNNIKYFVNPENMGISKTLNRGIEICTGEFVSFLASDDYYEIDKIEKQVEFLAKNKNVGLVFSDVNIVNNKGEFLTTWSKYKRNYKKYFLNGLPNANIYLKLISETFIPAASTMVRKAVLHEIGCFDEKMKIEDTDLNLRISEKYPIGYIDICLANYRLHGLNASRNFIFSIKGYLFILRKHFKRNLLRRRFDLQLLIILNILKFKLVNIMQKYIFRKM